MYDISIFFLHWVTPIEVPGQLRQLNRVPEAASALPRLFLSHDQSLSSRNGCDPQTFSLQLSTDRGGHVGKGQQLDLCRPSV